MSSRGFQGAVVAAVLAGVLAAPASSHAAVTCDFSSSVLTVDLAAQFDVADVAVSGANIAVTASTGPVTCTGAAPTVNNTAAVSIFNHPGAGGGSVVISEAGDFGPGPPGDVSENGGNSEIEIFINLNNAPNGNVSVRDAGGSIRWGASGINPNATPGEVQPDVDIQPNNVSNLEGRAGTTPSTQPGTLSALGGAGTGGPLTKDIELLGNNGIDDLTGGNGNDILWAFDGGDNLSGGPGNDDLRPEMGSDVVDGGVGTDTANFSQLSLPFAEVDLGVTGPQSTGPGGNDAFAHVEDLIGTTGPDVLRGDGGPNRIESSGGGDMLEGRGGNDTLAAGPGTDSLDVRDGGPDTANCGSEADSVTADRVSVDTINADCETVSFLPEPDLGGGDGGGGDPPTPTDTEIGFDLSGKAKQKVLKQKGVIVRASCPLEDCTTTTSGKGKVPKPKRSPLAQLNLKPVTEALAGGVTEKITLPLKRKQLRAIARALRAGKKPKVTVSASVTDAAGNAATDRVRVTAKR